MSVFRASLRLIREGLAAAHSITVHAKMFAPVSRAMFQTFSVHPLARVVDLAPFGTRLCCIFVNTTTGSTNESFLDNKKAENPYLVPHRHPVGSPPAQCHSSPLKQPPNHTDPLQPLHIFPLFCEGTSPL